MLSKPDGLNPYYVISWHHDQYVGYLGSAWVKLRGNHYMMMAVGHLFFEAYCETT